jgi:hypothetical protein
MTKPLPCRPLEAYIPVALAQDDVELELRSFCVVGLASRCITIQHPYILWVPCGTRAGQ